MHSLFNVLLDISERRLFNITFIYLRTAYGDYGGTLSNKILSFKRFEELSTRRQRNFNIHHISIFSYLCWCDLRFVNRSALNFQIWFALILNAFSLKYHDLLLRVLSEFSIQFYNIEKDLHFYYTCHNIDFHNKEVSCYEWKLINEDVELCYDTL